MRASNRLNRLQWVWLETRDTLIDGYKSRSLSEPGLRKIGDPISIILLAYSIQADINGVPIT